MIKLTALHYKVKVSALQRFHNIKEHYEGLVFDWENEVGSIRSIGSGEYPPKPFMEPFTFEPEDYNITEKKFRIRLKDIDIYKENEEGVTEITTGDDISYSIKESVDEIDVLFEKEKNN